MHYSTASDAEMDHIVELLHSDLDDTLKLSAPILWDQAANSCFKDTAMGYDCSAFHRIWQYRILWGLTNSMRPDSKFFISGLREIAQHGGKNDVLISASADYTMLAHILRAYKEEKSQPSVTILDRCLTPININRWYAEREGITINSIHNDLLDVDTDSRFDAICTHHFLVWFTLEQQYQVIKIWYELLKPGGKVITQTRLHEGHKGEIHQYTEQQAQALKEETLVAAIDNMGTHAIDPDEAAEVAYNYVVSGRYYFIDNVEFYREMFEKTGFSIEYMEIAETENKFGDVPSVQIPGSNGRLQIIARRL